jgi:hypothetical protein
LQGFSERRLETVQGPEAVAEVIDRSEMRQFTNRIVRQWRPVARIDEMDEALPIRLSFVELQPVEPELGIIE